MKGIIYRGPSMLDHRTPIVAIATDRTENSKTGNMVQTWILREDMSPVDAVLSGADSAICGACPARLSGRARDSAEWCYVNTATAPLSVWSAFCRGSYPDIRGSLTGEANRKVVRIGSYGDPATVPFDVWSEIIGSAEAHTGYTRQWKVSRFGAFRHICMASVWTDVERVRARAEGWRTFRVRMPWDKLLPREIPCPASMSGVQCADCRLCSGADDFAPDIAIEVHGGAALQRRLARLQRGRGVDV